ncbi:hypothetical protein DQ04_06841010 [Trypanosoma grayi]|uniref:hypothetical protein n=1 Tax=Trypanosoma grayi TaxID=71804 RepID=UPI0004F4BBE8|nr:hypothetical protein DQ04_06841010 [Trypanosoma grayi]KEG08593.1 hypothetical protein DQ04_06841010 [Trypanosoma grayi]
MNYDYEGYPLYSERRAPYVHYGPFEILTFLMSCAMGVAIVFSLSCAIGYLADLAEEFPTRAKKILHTMTIGVLVIHCLILLVDQLSWWRSFISIATNVLYLRILANFPHISPTQPLALITVVVLMVEMVSWYTLLALSHEYYGMVGVTKIISFVTFLWMVPVGLVISLELEPTGLPGSSLGATSSRHADIAAGGRKTTIVKVVKSWFALQPDK